MSRPAWPKAVPLLVLAGLCAYANCLPQDPRLRRRRLDRRPPRPGRPAGLLQGDGGPAAVGGLTNLALHRMGRNNPLGHHVLNVLDPPGRHADPLRGRPAGAAVAAVRRPVRGAGRVPGVRGRAAVDAAPAPGAVRHLHHPARRVDGRAVLPAHPLLHAAGGRGRTGRGASRGPGSAGTSWPSSASSSGSGRRRSWSRPRGPCSCSTASSWPGRSARWSAGGGCFYLFFLGVWGGFTGWHFYAGRQAAGGLGFGVETVTPKSSTP